jgi:hypothetical protein
MSRLTELHELVGEARVIRSESTGLIRGLIDEYRSERNKVSTDIDLSNEGKARKLSRISDKYEVKSLRLVEGLNKEYRKSLETARTKAEELMIGDLPQVDGNKKRLFDIRFKELSGRLAFANNYEDAKNMIREVVKLANEPVLAKEVADQFVNLSSNAIGLLDPSDQMRARKEIGQLFEDVSRNSKTEDMRQATELHETASGLLGSKVVGEIVKGAVEEISQNTSRYIDNTDEYFSSNAERVQAIELAEGLHDPTKITA